MPAQQISNTIRVQVDGKDLPPEVAVARIEVEDHLHLPDTFTITLNDMARTALGKVGAKIGAKVKLTVISDAAPSGEVLLSGEVTAVEAELFAGASYTIIRGYDESHRLFRGKVTESYRDMTYSDVAQKVGTRASLGKGTIDSTSPTHPHITQANENDWVFLNRLAREVNREVAVSEGKLHFRQPAESETGNNRRDLQADEPLLLQAGAALLYLRASVTAAEQVKEVQVRGWDVQAKQAMKTTTQVTTKSISNGTTPAKVAEVFPGPPLIATRVPYATAKEVQIAAKALAEEVASSYTEIEGAARGNPKLRSGASVQITLLGDPFDGHYVLTTTKHTYDNDEGYVTSFVISGRQERSMLNLAGGGNGHSMSGRISGVVPAIVDDVNDPKKQCRIRLQFPWMADGYVSDWSRVVQPGAGKNRGFVILPEVGDEVLVSFEQGDIGRPVVIGGLYNGKDTANVGPGSLLDNSSHEVNNRVFTSRKGHQLVFTDGADDCAILLKSGDGNVSIRLDQAKKKIVVHSAGDLEVTADGNLKVAATGNLELSGRSVKIEATSSAALKGSTVSVEGSGPVEVKGQPIKLN